MSEPTKTCPTCGAAILPTSRQPLCADCLWKLGLGPDAPDLVLSGSGAGGATVAPPPSIAELRPLFPQIEIQELVGQGGMGAVYRAVQRSLGREVALKLLTLDTSADPSFAERFEREARTLAGLSHPGIVTVFDFGKCGDRWYFIMEFVDGASLRQMLRAGSIGPKDALAIVGQICDVLQYAHEQGVVHRDIKPENVLVTKKGQVKILDFGLAKLVDERGKTAHLTRATQVMGTLHYMAPEQWEKPLTVDHRADIYALGVVFYELLTGELPLGRFAPPSEKARTDHRLDGVVLKSLEKEPERRYQHASDVKRDVQSVVDGDAPAADGVRSTPRRRARWPFVLGGAALLGMVVFAATTLVGRGEDGGTPESTPEQRAATPTRDVLGPIQDEPTLAATEAPAFGITEDALPRVDKALRAAWRDYLALEAAQSKGTWLKEQELQVDVAAFAGKRDSVLAVLEDALGPLLADPTRDGARRLTKVLRGRFTWGDSATGFEIHRLPGVGFEVTPKRKFNDIYYGKPVQDLEPHHQRQWDRFQSTRPK